MIFVVEEMRLNVILITIVLGGLASGAVFSLFAPIIASDHEPANLVAQPLSDRQHAFLLPVTETNYSPIRDFNVPEPEISAEAAVLYDVKSGRFLYSKNINKRLPIASITKLMSAIVILENFDLDEIFTVPTEAINVDGLGADFQKDEQLQGIDLLKIMLIKSSNDAALVFSGWAQKQGIDFIGEMNQMAVRIGMFNSRFSDPAGLDDEGTFSTAADLVKLINRLADYKPISEILQQKSATVNSTSGANHYLTNTNQLLGQIPGIIIGKTGYTDKALGTMVLEVELSGDNRIISVILGSNDRFGETKKLIEWGKQAYYWEN